VLLAGLIAVVHAAAIVFMLCGALLALRWPRLAWVHAPVAVAFLAVNLAHMECPLTGLELALRAHAGMPAYRGGFLAHYLFGPIGVDEHSTVTQICIYTVALLPNLIGYGLLLARPCGGDGVRPSAARASRRPAGTGPSPGSRR
jgi:Protein of Unknown function (DUF2784)